jgi:hypothetical protein
LWYQTIGAISEDEAKQAMESPNLVCVQPFAGFHAGDLRIACQENRWEISTTNAASRSRLFDIARIVFEKLYETPINVFGMNTRFDLETVIPDVAPCLVGLFTGLGIGLPMASGKSSQLELTYEDDHVTRISVQPSTLAPDLIHVRYNSEYVTKNLVPEPGYFDFGKLLEKPFIEHYERAEAQAGEIVSAVTAKCRE